MATDRHAWAVERLALEGHEQVLEIGCGRGLATVRVCARLTTGRVTAIDRSANAIAAARKRNDACLAAGRLMLIQTSLADLAIDTRPFDLAFAVNVNLFWIGAGRELAVLRNVLAPGGRLHLVYQPPSPAKRDSLIEQCRRALDADGFELMDMITAAPDLLSITASAVG